VNRTWSLRGTLGQPKSAFFEDIIAFDGFDNVDDGLFLLCFSHIESPGRAFETVDDFFSRELLQYFSDCMFTCVDFA